MADDALFEAAFGLDGTQAPPPPPLLPDPLAGLVTGSIYTHRPVEPGSVWDPVPNAPLAQPSGPYRPPVRRPAQPGAPRPGQQRAGQQSWSGEPVAFPVALPIPPATRRSAPPAAPARVVAPANPMTPNATTGWAASSPMTANPTDSAAQRRPSAPARAMYTPALPTAPFGPVDPKPVDPARRARSSPGAGGQVPQWPSTRLPNRPPTRLPSAGGQAPLPRRRRGPGCAVVLIVFIAIILLFVVIGALTAGSGSSGGGG